MRIVKPQTAFAPGKNTKPVKRDDYTAWIKTLPCVSCRTFGVDPSHISHERRDYGHLGRAKVRRASDRWILPQCRRCHTQLHDTGELEYWHKDQHYADPYVMALVLFGLWSDLRSDATQIAEELILKGELQGIGGT